VAAFHIVPVSEEVYQKKARQVLVSSSLDSLGLSAAVAHVSSSKDWFDGLRGGRGVGCVYCRFTVVRKVTVTPLLS
jgi:hypothetical protein